MNNNDNQQNKNLYYGFNNNDPYGQNRYYNGPVNNLRIYSNEVKRKKSKLVRISAIVLSASLLAGLGISIGTFMHNRAERYRIYDEMLKNKTAVTEYYVSPDIEDVLGDLEIAKETVTPTPSVVPTPMPSTTNEYLEELYNSNTAVVDFNQTTRYLVKVDTDEFMLFKNYIDNIKVKYPYEELFQIKEALARYYKVTFASATYNKVLESSTGNGEISADKLYNVVMQNNKAYLSDPKNRFGGVYYQELDSNTIKETCQIICDTFNSYMKMGKIDVNRAKSYLAELKIFTGPYPVNAYLTTDTCLIVNENIISTAQILNPKVDAFRDIIIHETIHTFQNNSQAINEANGFNNHGIAYEWPDLDINPLMYDWFYEAAAEKNMSNYTGDEPITYHHMIGYLDSMSLATFLDDNFTPNCIEDINFSKKIEPLFDIFDCESDDKKEELIKMLYSLDIMHMETEDFFKVLEDRYGKTLDAAERDELKFTIKGSVCLTLSKSFYLNLAEAIKDKDIPLEDVFFIITVFENDLNSHLKYTKNDNLRYNKEFLNDYVKLQNSFFDMIAGNATLTANEIEDLYNNYAMNVMANGDKKLNCSLDWMTSTQREYILKKQVALKDYGTSNIRTTNEAFANQRYSVNNN
jgi:hypothetical protein